MVRGHTFHTLQELLGVTIVWLGDMGVLMRTAMATPRGWCNA